MSRALELCPATSASCTTNSARSHQWQLKVTSWLDKPVEVPASDDGRSPIQPTRNRTLAGRYRLDDLIAKAVSAQVWKASTWSCIATAVRERCNAESRWGRTPCEAIHFRGPQGGETRQNTAGFVAPDLDTGRVRRCKLAEREGHASSCRRYCRGWCLTDL